MHNSITDFLVTKTKMFFFLQGKGNNPCTQFYFSFFFAGKGQNILRNIVVTACLPTNNQLIVYEQSLFAQPISIQKAQSRKKSPQTFAHLVNFSKNASVMFDNHTILLF